MSKLVKRTTSKGKQAEIARSKKATTASKGKGASAAPSEDTKKTSTLTLKGKKADALAEGHAKSIAEKDDAQTKTETGMLVSRFVEVMALVLYGWVDIVDSR